MTRQEAEFRLGTFRLPRKQTRPDLPILVRVGAIKRGEMPRDVLRKLLKARPSEERDRAMRKVVRQIPRGKVATYSQVAAAAGYPLYHRQVVQLLRRSGDSLPWQRVVGAGGEIKLRYEAGMEQRVRLQLEGVTFRGKRVDMTKHQYKFKEWDWWS
jgi:methylated-DNA-protein-cysteine methyltransferase-like protein